ncbi:hypothetical protein BZG02_18740 [Labilibaculum filiforme]|uniref:Gliding motility-associated protein GldM first immunoglobulin-like domain-containing protein n=1 Tax=Labilibaculum filiforme TaxID=1940526 RepID=A0A2N3HRE2_9BACT|nr:hypothetical protein [Labilibaculum filiforme]PKQ60628.1 hypothetical protein BZG02_18740 [Labilibaculum filiforme]
MKYLSIIIILLIGCNQKPDLQKEIDQQLQLVNEDYAELMNDLMILNSVNPVKYEFIITYFKGLDDAYKTIENELFSEDHYDFSLVKYHLGFYCRIIEESEWYDIIKNQYSKCNTRVVDFTQESHKTNEEKELLLLYLKTFQRIYTQSVLKEITNSEFKFNFIRPVVLEKKNRLKEGDEYEAQIFLSAVDTTKMPIFKIKNGLVGLGPYGQGVVKIKAKNKGITHWGGTVIWTKDSGIQLIFDVHDSFVVE